MVTYTKVPWYSLKAAGIDVPNRLRADGVTFEYRADGPTAVISRENAPAGGTYEIMIPLEKARTFETRQAKFLAGRAEVRRQREEARRQARALTLHNAEGFKARVRDEIWRRLDPVLAAHPNKAA
jgi:hypothetical protein